MSRELGFRRKKRQESPTKRPKNDIEADFLLGNQSGNQSVCQGNFSKAGRRSRSMD